MPEELSIVDFVFHMDEGGRSDGWVYGPPFFELILTYLWVLMSFFVVVSAMLLKRNVNRLNEVASLLIWAGTTLILINVPPPTLPFQVQSHIGLTAPIIIVISKALFDFGLFGLRSFRLPNLLNWAFALVLVTLSIHPNALLYDNLNKRLSSLPFPEFIDVEAQDLFKWATSNLHQSSVVVTHSTWARVFAGFTGCRVYYRNPVDSEETKEYETLRSWSQSVSTGICNNGILKSTVQATHLFVENRFLASTQIEETEQLKLCGNKLFESGRYSLWELKLTTNE